MELLADNPIRKQTEDTFGFLPFVEILTKAIIDTTSLPFTVGIFGEWGTGKTSLMNLLKDQLESKGCKAIWFNPWKYDGKEELWTALIHSILLEIYKKSPQKKVKDAAWALLRNVAWFTLERGITSATHGIVSANDVEKMKDTMAEISKREHSTLNEFETGFSKVVEEYLGEASRLVIFIDDLDRCIPENAITVLESLKLYLDNSRSIFVLGMDRSIIELGIKQRYGGNILLTGREYLEKIVQLPFFLPPVQFGKLQQALQSQSNTAKDYSPQIWTLLRYGLGGNPRKAKRFVNSFYMAKEALQIPQVASQLVSSSTDDVANTGDIKYEDQLFYLAKILVIQMSYTDFYDYLIVNPSGWKAYEEDLQNPLKKEDLSQKYPELATHLQNIHLSAFMRRTSGDDFPQPPSPLTLERVLRFTGIIARNEPTRTGEMERSHFKSESRSQFEPK
jgi:hypothetical protein